MPPIKVAYFMLNFLNLKSFLRHLFFWVASCLSTLWAAGFNNTDLFTTSDSPKIRIRIDQIFCYDFFNDSATNNLRQVLY